MFYNGIENTLIQDSTKFRRLVYQLFTALKATPLIKPERYTLSFLKPKDTNNNEHTGIEYCQP